MYRTKVTSPDLATYRKVSALLSRNGASVAASSTTTLSHVVTSKLSVKLTEGLEALGAALEVTT